MKAQKPAEGVLKVGDYGNSMWYHIRCECGNDTCSHEVDIEADDMNVQVHTYVTVTTKWWQKNRWKQIWQILTKGYAEMQSTIVMNEQTTLNYAESLKSAMKDVKIFRDERMGKK